MLANIVTSQTQQILRGCSSHAPAATVALARVFPKENIAQSSRTYITRTKHIQHPIMKNCVTNHLQSSHLQRPTMTACHWFATQPIICGHEDAFAKDLSAEEFDNAYLSLYEQHGHAHGPWVKVLNSAQNILTSSTPRVLVIASGPGEPAATLAQNFKNAEIISA